MQEKTKIKIDRQLNKLPKHHIDTSIIMGETDPNNKEEKKEIEQYLHKVNYNYKGVISFPTMSELFLCVLRVEDYNKKKDLIEVILETLKVRRISQYAPKNIEEILMKIREIDFRIDSLDRQILACAIEDKADVLVIKDSVLEHNEKIENIFNIKIRHPRELL